MIKSVSLSSLPVVTVSEMVEVDRLMINDYRISLVQMMENAGKHLSELGRELTGGNLVNKNVTVLCGHGHNGGGGLVAARYLANFGASVTVVLAAEEHRLKATPLMRWQTLNKIPVRTIVGPFDEMTSMLKESHLIIDAILGYGLIGTPKGLPDRIMSALRQLNLSTILSLDIPSGVNGDTGIPSVNAVKAMATMTLALPKAGLFTEEAQPYVGDLYLADIGVPPVLYSKMGLPATPIFAEDSILKID